MAYQAKKKKKVMAYTDIHRHKSAAKIIMAKM